MERSYLWHAGVAAGLGMVALGLAGLTWLPGVAPFTGATWPGAVMWVLAALVFLAAVVRVLVNRAYGQRGVDAVWRLMLAGKGWFGLLGLAVFCAAVTVTVGLDGGARPEKVEDGRYFAADSGQKVDGRPTVFEVSRAEYEDARENGLRAALGVPGGLLVIAACLALVAGEAQRMNVEGVLSEGALV
ncbi:hypothetical protein [Yinghuangia soli]|uniref:Uncharacterized protein n=1 Tax=Yinghuangia soli TaxID=2908204 RepID=A0AA41Q4H3_9ACTN|nr:hypothetical protein [Yinghuangia soli]MCF2531393.1 hypothetical protein [Yinghuangia soli]